ncbi:mucin-1-like isoform X2 [Panthera tigris]|uniref:mucin-1-like isoform X2 n=1 Tax=Panthera tigris TaxID=9694 RepID=UPI001C6F6A92|nr:mucin-1-like isoform X2 [Panthera tigris]
MAFKGHWPKQVWNRRPGSLCTAGKAHRTARGTQKTRREAAASAPRSQAARTPTTQLVWVSRCHCVRRPPSFRFLPGTSWEQKHAGPCAGNRVSTGRGQRPAEAALTASCPRERSLTPARSSSPPPAGPAQVPDTSQRARGSAPPPRWLVVQPGVTGECLPRGALGKSLPLCAHLPRLRPSHGAPCGPPCCSGNALRPHLPAPLPTGSCADRPVLVGVPSRVPSPQGAGGKSAPCLSLQESLGDTAAGSERDLATAPEDSREPRRTRARGERCSRVLSLKTSQTPALLSTAHAVPLATAPSAHTEAAPSPRQRPPGTERSAVDRPCNLWGPVQNSKRGSSAVTGTK